MRPAALGALAAALVTLAPAVAVAIPAFSRTYQTACATCHGAAPPTLNDFGRRFQERGYQYPPGAEEPARARATRRLGGADDRLLSWDTVPLSLEAASTATMAVAPDASAGRGALDLRAFDRLRLTAGGSVYPDVSLFVGVDLAEPGVAHGAIGFHDLGPVAGALNLRVGRLLLLDFARPSDRTLTRAGYLGLSRPVGLNPTVLDGAHDGVDAHGRLWARRLFYRVAVVQGARRDDGGDLDGYKDVFGQVELSAWDRLSVGALGYVGRTQITDDSRGVVVRFTDRMWAAGGTAALAAGPIDLFARVVYAAHRDPYGTGARDARLSATAEATATLAPRWLLVVRYDHVHDHHDPGEQRVVVHVTHLLLSNLKLSLESEAWLDDVERSSVSVRLGLAL